jgi:hypothetical protein
MADFFVRIDDLGDHASAFAKLSTSADAASRAFVAGFSELADVWGNDAPGHAFFAGYREPATETLRCAVQMPVQLAALSAAMRQTALGYLGTEALNVDLGKGATTA